MRVSIKALGPLIHQVEHRASAGRKKSDSEGLERSAAE